MHAEIHVVAVRKVLACGNDKERSRVQGVCEDRPRAVQSLEFHPASVIVAEGVTEKLDAHRKFPGGHLVLDKQVQVGFDLLDIAEGERTQGRPESVTRPVRVEMQPTGDDPVGIVAGAQIAHGDAVCAVNDLLCGAVHLNPRDLCPSHDRPGPLQMPLPSIGDHPSLWIQTH